MSRPSVEPIDGFHQFDLPAELRRGITAAGFTAPRPIQAAAVPAALEGRDILGLAQTGTGKTAAFALPILSRLLARPGQGPRILILAPTRELASQIDAEIRLLGRFTRIRTTTVFGGVSVVRQRDALRARPEILVACPGRLLDLMQQGAVRLDKIETLVLDEADHMFDQGFLPDILRIIAALPVQRQNLLFSATMPREIRSLANRILRDPHVVDVAHSRPLTTIEHALYPIHQDQKSALLERILAEDGFVSAIVFTRTKHRAKRLALQLDKAGHRAVALQGNMSQGQRDRAMEGFRKRQFDVLVATDIAARGIDIEQVSHVVNFDVPGTPDAYTHRIGRTGRSERSGKAYTFVTTEDRSMVAAIEQKLGSPIPRRTIAGIPSAPLTIDARPPRAGRPGPARPARRPQGGRGSGSRRSGAGRERRAS